MDQKTIKATALEKAAIVRQPLPSQTAGRAAHVEDPQQTHAGGMGCSMITAAFLLLGVYILVHHQQNVVSGHAVPPSGDSSNGPVNNGNTLNLAAQRGRGRTLVLGPRVPGSPQYVRARLAPVEAASDILNDFIIDDEELNEINKRQSDDYGHMRFGKREPFDDYGHMRFGRSAE